MTGPATVIDADIISIDSQRVILWGIDAPEPGQVCKLNGRDWACRDAAVRNLETLSSRGDVTCFFVGEPDPFGRRFGACEIGGEDIAAEMVRDGMALAYVEQTADYSDEQLEAIQAQVGLWQLGVEFMEPWVFRSINTDSDIR
ncbi:MAG TPA: thermonuclease family protein [Devosia sp.]|nr:thermonuclease family protein [Devosia sp.]